MGLLMNGLHNYLISLLEDKRENILLEMEAYAKNRGFPIVGPLVGHFLMQYTQMIRARRILELGSGFGYSAVWFAKGKTNAEIICTDRSEDNKNIALSYFRRLRLENIRFIVGDALEIIQQLEGKFDIIFCDIDKKSYPKAFKIATPRLKLGGLLITDNTLWKGRILESKPSTVSTKGVQDFNKLAFSDPNVISTIVPIGDGICVSLKI
ncbi:MAG: O-methyltransferase [Candidatus Hodarchaeota archaeon]